MTKQRLNRTTLGGYGHSKKLMDRAVNTDDIVMVEDQDGEPIQALRVPHQGRYPHFRPRRKHHPEFKKQPWMSLDSYNVVTDHLNCLSNAELRKLAKEKKKGMNVFHPAWTQTYKPEEFRNLAAAILKERAMWEQCGFTWQFERLL